MPIAHVTVERRLVGVTPPTLTLALAAVALTAGGFLVGLGHWIWAAALFVAGILLFAIFLEVGRRQPDAALARASVETVDSVRARAGYAVELLRTRSAARREVLRRRTELMELAARRSALLSALGEAAYREDAESVAAKRDALRAGDERAAQVEQEIGRLVEQARRRARRAALEVEPTEVLARDDDSKQD